MADSSENTTNKQRKIGKGMPPEGWKPGQSGNPNGRPKKVYSKFPGYKASEINETYMALLMLSIEELEKIRDDKTQEYTALEQWVASSIITGKKNGQLREIETLLNRTYGFPKQSIDQSSSVKLDVTTTDEQAKKLYADTIAALEQIDKDAEQPKTE